MEASDDVDEQAAVDQDDQLDADVESRRSLLGPRRTSDERLQVTRCTSVPDSLPHSDDATTARQFNCDLTNNDVDVDSNLPSTVSHHHHHQQQQQQQHQHHQFTCTK